MKKKEEFIKPQGSFAEIKAALAPLKCEACGSNVALQNHSPVKCESCGASVPIPKEYLDLKKQREAHRLQLEKANDVNRKLAKVPIAFIEKLSNVLSSIFLFLAIPFYLLGFFSIFIVYLACVGLAYATGYNWMDIYGITKIHGIFGSIASLLLVLPLILEEVYLKSKELKQVVTASLSAKIHFGAKDEFDCRCCGNRLAIEANEQAVVCDYCDTENLIIYDKEYLKRISNDAKWKVNKIEAALKLQKENKKQIRESFFIYTGIYVVGILAFLIVGWILDGALVPEDKPKWEKFSIEREPYLNKTVETSTIKNKFGSCYFSDWFMLTKGETVELLVSDPNAKMIFLDDYNLGWDENKYETYENSDGTVLFKYKAAYTGTFKLEVKTETPSSVRVSIVN